MSYDKYVELLSTYLPAWGISSSRRATPFLHRLVQRYNERWFLVWDFYYGWTLIYYDKEKDDLYTLIRFGKREIAPSEVKNKIDEAIQLKYRNIVREMHEKYLETKERLREQGREDLRKEIEKKLIRARRIFPMGV